MKEKYWGKVILFGEYSMIFDSTALVFRGAYPFLRIPAGRGVICG